MPRPPDAPDVPGLTFRSYRGEADIAPMLAVHEGCRAADKTDPYSVCYRLPNLPPDEYAREVSLPSSNGSNENVLLAEIAGQVITHGRLEWWSSYDGGLETRVYLTRAWVLPEWRGKGIGTALLHWAEARARTLNAGGPPGELAANASEGEADTRRLLETQATGCSSCHRNWLMMISTVCRPLRRRKVSRYVRWRRRSTAPWRGR